MTPPWHMCVLIPARDEEALLPRCLKSVRRAITCLNGAATADVIVAADLCIDRTPAIARSYLSQIGTMIELSVGAAGTARLLATRAALTRTRRPLKYCWLANTDADCVVPATWLMDQLRFARAGVEACAGTINVDSFEEHGPEVPERFRTSYVVEADGSHSHVHGANFGIRADVYLDAGGWSKLQTAEDHDLWRRLQKQQRRILSTSRIEVTTSGRRKGRAPDGFAAALAAHNEVAA